MIYFTSLCIPVAKAEEGAPTEMAGTVAADSNPLDLFVDSTVALPGLKGNHLDNSEMEKKKKVRLRREKDFSTNTGEQM